MNTRRPRRQHKSTRCPATGLRRLDERKDVRLALRNAQHARWAAESRGQTSYRQERAAFLCESCHGFHLVRRQGGTA